jgi:hypothetical protein
VFVRPDFKSNATCGWITALRLSPGTAFALNLATAWKIKDADIAVEAEPTVVEKPPNKAVKSLSIFFAIASPNNLPISAATFLGAEFLAKSVRVVIIPCSVQVIVFEVGSIAVLDKSVASDTSAADTAE